MRASVPAPCPQVPGLPAVPVQPLLADSVPPVFLPEPLVQDSVASVPLVPLQPPLADSVLPVAPVLPQVASVLADSVPQVAWA